MTKDEQIRLHDELTKRLRAAQNQTDPPVSSGQLDILERVMKAAPEPDDIELDSSKSAVTFYKDERSRRPRRSSRPGCAPSGRRLGMERTLKQGV